MVIMMTLQQMIDDKFSLLREQINPTNKPELNSTFQIQEEDAIRSTAQDLERVESIIAQKKELLKNCKDMQETDTLLAKLEALEWLQGQMALFYSRNQR